MPGVSGAVCRVRRFSPLVTHTLMHVPVTEAADASGLLTTTIQLGQAIGVATFGSLFLTLAAHRVPNASAHAIGTTMVWLAVMLALSAVSGVFLSRAARAQRAAA